MKQTKQAPQQDTDAESIVLKYVGFQKILFIALGLGILLLIILMEQFGVVGAIIGFAIILAYMIPLSRKFSRMVKERKQ